MQKLMILCMGILMLGLFSCEKENLQASAESPELSAKRPPLSQPCPTALMIQGLSPSSATCSVTDLSTNTNITTFSNGTSYVTLATNKSYFVDIQGSSAATFYWCSCGDNIGSTTIPAGGSFILDTSLDPSNYTTCAF